MDCRLILIHAPIWRSPRFAATHDEFTVPSCSALEATPALRVKNPIPRSDPAGGVLRWLDLDVLVALHGSSRAGSCTVGHQDLMRAMGYVVRRRLPYRATLASLRRLAVIHIELQRSGDAAGAWEVRGPLLRHFNAEMTAGQRLLHVAVDPWWNSSLATWWTPSDGRMYRALGRADRIGGLARQLYVLLANLRQCDGMVDLPVAFLIERFADRHGPGQHGKLRFRNPGDPRSQLGADLGLLHRLGMWSCEPVAGSRETVVLRGRLRQPIALPPDYAGRVRRSAQCSIDPAQWEPRPGSVDEEHIVLDPDDESE